MFLHKHFTVAKGISKDKRILIACLKKDEDFFKELEYDEIQTIKKVLEKAKSNFSIIQKVILKDLKEDILTNVTTLFDNGYDSKKIGEKLQEMISFALQEKNYIFFSDTDKLEINIPYNQLKDFKFVKKEKEIIKDSFIHDIVVGVSAVGGAMLLGNILNKFAGKTGSIAGALIGGFIGSAAGSGIGEDFLKTEVKVKEGIDIQYAKEKIEKILNDLLPPLIDNFKDNILKELSKIEKILEQENNLKNDTTSS